MLSNKEELASRSHDITKLNPVIQYVDDTILILPAYPTQAKLIKDILMDYATSIDLKLNFHKSTLIPINCDDSLSSAGQYLWLEDRVHAIHLPRSSPGYFKTNGAGSIKIL